jgi:predicted Holliday junction resolvase-like endonuclease
MASKKTIHIEVKTGPKARLSKRQKEMQKKMGKRKFRVVRVNEKSPLFWA